MAIISVIWLGYEFWRLLFQVGDMGAIDLRNRHNELQTWIEGKMFTEHGTAMYPPASYVLLYPLMGWLSFGAARWFWALTTIVALVILVRQSLSFIVLNQKHKTWQFFVAITFYRCIRSAQLSAMVNCRFISSLFCLFLYIYYKTPQI
ncbi:MAG: DUF2029 domain-containing protein [Calditrichae bacterium]|nr:DUF2029 domain-containing protein [Calditrichia bacterium]